MVVGLTGTGKSISFPCEERDRESGKWVGTLEGFSYTARKESRSSSETAVKR